MYFILAAKATASANAASIDDSATDTVTGTCFAVTKNAPSMCTALDSSIALKQIL